TPETAEKAIRDASPGASAGQYGGTVLGAAEKLLAEYKKYENPPTAAQNLELIKNLGTYTAVVPRIVQAVHLGLAKQAVGIPNAGTSEEYLTRIEEARNKRNDLIQIGTPANSPQIAALDAIIDRAKRRELWIQKLSMNYYENLGNAAEIQSQNFSGPERDEF